MSLIKEKRQVTADVSVVYCDGPACNVSAVTEYPDPDRAPAGWYLVRYWRSYYTTSSRSDAVGPYHFHNERCLAAWSAELAKPAELIDPSKELTT